MKEKGFRVIANVVILITLLSVLGITVYVTTDRVAPTSAVYGGDVTSGGVAIMINVYEGTDYALKMADVFCEYGFSATFFVGGRWVERNQNALIELYAKGMEIGNHGYLHRDHARLSKSQNRDEIIMCQKLIDNTLLKVDGYQNSMLFAPPSGSLGEDMFSVCDDLGYKVIMWTRDTIDWRDHDSNLIYDRSVKDIKGGDLILMHPTRETLIALPQILDTIKSIGLKADTVSNVIN